MLFIHTQPCKMKLLLLRLVKDPESSWLGEIMEAASAPPTSKGLLLSGAAASEMRSSGWI